MQVDGDAEQSMDVGGTGDKQSILNLSKKKEGKAPWVSDTINNNKRNW
jgi:hypothetical protein